MSVIVDPADFRKALLATLKSLNPTVVSMWEEGDFIYVGGDDSNGVLGLGVKMTDREYGASGMPPKARIVIDVESAGKLISVLNLFEGRVVIKYSNETINVVTSGGSAIVRTSIPAPIRPALKFPDGIEFDFYIYGTSPSDILWMLNADMDGGTYYAGAVKSDKWIGPGTGWVMRHSNKTALFTLVGKSFVKPSGKTVAKIVGGVIGPQELIDFVADTRGQNSTINFFARDGSLLSSIYSDDKRGNIYRFSGLDDGAISFVGAIAFGEPIASVNVSTKNISESSRVALSSGVPMFENCAGSISGKFDQIGDFSIDGKYLLKMMDGLGIRRNNIAKFDIVIFKGNTYAILEKKVGPNYQYAAYRLN